MAPIGGIIFVGIIGFVLLAVLGPAVFALFRLYATRSAAAKSGWEPKLVRRDIFLAVLTCATIYAFVRAAFFSPEVLFQQEVGAPAPKSLHVLKQESDGGSTWIHFQISPADLKPLLKSGEFKDYNAAPDLPENISYPDWWKARRDHGWHIYVCAPSPFPTNLESPDAWYKEIYVSPQGNDAYYEHRILDWF